MVERAYRSRKWSEGYLPEAGSVFPAVVLPSTTTFATGCRELLMAQVEVERALA
jgi:hypothetical protein